MTKIWTTKVEQGEDGELYITFPEDMLTAMGWKVGDALTWHIKEDGSIILRKASA